MTANARLLLFAGIVLHCCVGQCDESAPTCGRDLQSPVWYEVAPSDGGALPDYTALVRLDPIRANYFDSDSRDTSHFRVRLELEEHGRRTNLGASHAADRPTFESGHAT